MNWVGIEYDKAVTIKLSFPRRREFTDFCRICLDPRLRGHDRVNLIPLYENP